MQNKQRIASIFIATALFTVAGLMSYRNAETGKTEQINRDQVKSMGELDN